MRNEWRGKRVTEEGEKEIKYINTQNIHTYIEREEREQDRMRNRDNKWFSSSRTRLASRHWSP